MLTPRWALTRYFTVPLLFSGHCERELFFILFVVMAESEGPSVTPPRKKPKRQSHFDASWIQEFQDRRNQMSHNHFFNVSDPHTCCYDAKELISKCKKAKFVATNS